MSIVTEFIFALAALLASVAALLNAAAKFKREAVSKPSAAQTKPKRDSVFKQWIFWFGFMAVLYSFVFLFIMMLSPAHPATSRDVAMVAMYLIDTGFGFFNIVMSFKFVQPNKSPEPTAVTAGSSASRFTP